jgi:hypothetical protein
MKLRKHDVTLIGSRITLRPLTEDDWDILLAWCSDPTEGDDARGHGLAQVQEICRGDGARRSQVGKRLESCGRLRPSGVQRRRA